MNEEGLVRGVNDYNVSTVCFSHLFLPNLNLSLSLIFLVSTLRSFQALAPLTITERSAATQLALMVLATMHHVT